MASQMEIFHLSPQYSANYYLFWYEIFALTDCLFFVNFVNENASRSSKMHTNKDFFYKHIYGSQRVYATKYSSP